LETRRRGPKKQTRWLRKKIRDETRGKEARQKKKLHPDTGHDFKPWPGGERQPKGARKRGGETGKRDRGNAGRDRYRPRRNCWRGTRG